MALLGFEGFDCLSTSGSGRQTQQDLPYMPFGGGTPSKGVWALSGSGQFSKVAGLLGGFAIGAEQVSFGMAPTVRLSANYSRIIIGYRYLVSSAFFVATDIGRFYDGSTIQCGLGLNNTGKLIFWRGTTANILATGTQTLVPAGWYMIEVDVTISNAAGAVEVRVDGATELSVSGVDTQNTANAFLNALDLVLPAGNTAPNVAFDDFYANDTTGPAPYNTFLGVIRVETTFVGADVSVAWTPLSGTNASNVDEQNNDQDTTYNSCTAAAIDLFTHGGLVNTPVTIFAVDVIASVRKNDVTNQSYRTKLVSGATTQNGHTMNPATVYQYVRDTYQTDPNTGLAWTAAALNATNVGYERL